MNLYETIKKNNTSLNSTAGRTLEDTLDGFNFYPAYGVNKTNTGQIKTKKSNKVIGYYVLKTPFRVAVHLNKEPLNLDRDIDTDLTVSDEPYYWSSVTGNIGLLSDLIRANKSKPVEKAEPKQRVEQLQLDFDSEEDK